MIVEGRCIGYQGFNKCIKFVPGLTAVTGRPSRAPFMQALCTNNQESQMSSSHIFWPVLAQILLTLVMFIVLGARKAKAVKAGRVNRKEAALDNRVWPEDVVKVSNNIANQFEIPVLFYVLCFVLYSINAAGSVAVFLAWLFVVSRYAHAYVHVTSNYIPVRLPLFMTGALVLLAMLAVSVWNLAA